MRVKLLKPIQQEKVFVTWAETGKSPLLVSAGLPDSPAITKQTKVYLDNEVLAVWFSLHQEEVVKAKVYLEHATRALEPACPGGQQRQRFNLQRVFQR